MAARSRDSSTSRSAQPGPRNDAYTGLLLISLLAQIVGVVFFYLDWSAYPTSKPTVPSIPNLSAPAAGGGAPAPAPVPPAGGPPMAGGAPMGGGNPP